MTDQTSAPLQVDIVSDVMCPWCYIGKRRIEQAIARSEVPITVLWRPYQLDATLPPGGKDRQAYLADKFGSIEKARSFYANIETAGQDEDIPFDFAAIAVSPNTLDAHRLIRWAGTAAKLNGDPELQDKVVEALFKAYFVDGRNIGEHSVLKDIAADCGMDADLVAELLAGDDDKELVSKEIELAQQMGVTGVPTFILGNKYAVVGAQGPEQLLQAIKGAATALASDDKA